MLRLEGASNEQERRQSNVMLHARRTLGHLTRVDEKYKESGECRRH